MGSVEQLIPQRVLKYFPHLLKYVMKGTSYKDIYYIKVSPNAAADQKHSDHYNNTMEALSETHLYYGGRMEGEGGNL